MSVSTKDTVPSTDCESFVESCPAQEGLVMSARDRKKSAKRPRVEGPRPSENPQDPDAVTPELRRSYRAVVPGQRASEEAGAHGESHSNNPADDTREMGSHSSGLEVQEAREPVQKRIEEFKGDVTRALMSKRKQFTKDINDSFRSLNENLQGIFKTQQEARLELRSKYIQMFDTLHEKWLEEVGRSREQEEHLILVTQQQVKILQNAMEDHEIKLGKAKNLCGAFLKKTKDLSESRRGFIGGTDSEVGREISRAENRVIMQSQEQDVSVVKTYLESLVVGRSEETT